MKNFTLFLFLFTSMIYSQTTHQLDWNMSSTNQQITIDVGDTVTWTWGGGTHNLRSTGGVEDFESDYFTGPGPQFSYTFTSPGVTTYICDPHPNSMYGAVTVTGTASIGDINILNFGIYPNPASEKINLTLENDLINQIKVEVFNVMGKQIFSDTIIKANNKFTVEITSLQRGIYFIKVFDQSKSSIKRFIKS